MNPKDLLAKVGSVSAAVGALLAATQSPTLAEERSRLQKAHEIVREPEFLMELTQPTAPKLVLSPVGNSSHLGIGHGSHRSHSSHSSHRSGSGHASHYSHRSSTTYSGADPAVKVWKVSEAISASDLAGASNDTLVSLRTEILARHGYSFATGTGRASSARKRFSKADWYTESVDDESVVAAELTHVELDNLKVITRVDDERHHPRKVADQSEDEARPDSSVAATKDGLGSPESKDKLSLEQLAGKSDEELALIRNEVLARHGYKFPGKSARAVSLRKYFSKQPWYHGTTDDETTVIGSITHEELDNIKLIQKVEAERKGNGKNDK